MIRINGRDIAYFIFPGGELNPVVSNDLGDVINITWKPKDAQDIIMLGLVVNALRHANYQSIHLQCLYLPYARQDRVCNPGEALSIDFIMNYLEMLNLNSITFFDVHNRYAFPGLESKDKWSFISRSSIVLRNKIIDKINDDNLFLCAPDEGAYWEMMQISLEREGRHDSDFFIKNRDSNTGKIISYHLNGNPAAFSGHNVFIIDDICDGGETFLRCADALHGFGAKDLYLYVTHGIFSKGLEELNKRFKHIYCHHVLFDDKFVSDEKLTILREFNV